MLKYILLLILLPVNVFAGDWDKTDKALFGSFVVFDTIDCLQTKEIFDSSTYKEVNPIINKIGDKYVIPYFIADMVGTYLIADHLSPKWRKIFLSLSLGTEILFVRNNYKIGVKIRF